MEQFENSNLFGNLTRVVQVRFDAISEAKKRLFDNIIYPRFLTWDAPSVGLNFEEIIGQYNISIAAPTVGENSNAPIIGTEGLQTVRERMVRHLIRRKLTDAEVRKIMELKNNRIIADSQRTQQLIDIMWGKVTDVVQSVEDKIDMIFLGALSNEGKFVLDETNNPEGGARGEINYNQPETNIASATEEWKAGANVDVFEDIQAVLDAASDKVSFDKILISPAKLSYICRNARLKKVIFGSDKAESVLLPAALNQFMAANGMPQFEVIRRQMRVQNGTEIKTYSPWNEKNLVFVPAGNLGIIKNAYTNDELNPEPGISYANHGRIRVSQWQVGKREETTGAQYVEAESISLPVITEMNGIYTLKTEA